MEKASVEYVEIMFLCERFVQGDCCKTVQQVEQCLAAINTKMGKLNALKKNISTHVKGLEWSEYHTPWSANGLQHAIEFLKNHLTHIITDSSTSNKQAQNPVFSMPSRNKLPSLGMLTVDVRAQEEEDEDALASMETNCNEERQRLIEEGLRD